MTTQNFVANASCVFVTGFDGRLKAVIAAGETANDTLVEVLIGSSDTIAPGQLVSGNAPRASGLILSATVKLPANITVPVDVLILKTTPITITIAPTAEASCTLVVQRS